MNPSETERDPSVALTARHDGTITLSKHLTHDKVAREVKLSNLAEEFQQDFEGTETEQNWTRRQTNIIVLRKITKGNTPDDFAALFLAILKTLLDGIVKGATSLRTSLSVHGTELIEEVVRAIGSKLDSTFDILFAALEKQALTKPTQAKAANQAMIALLDNLSYHLKMLNSLSRSMDSKNKNLRSYVIGWLETLLARGETTQDSHTDAIEKILRQGLNDADGVIREKSRPVFWLYASKFETEANNLFESFPKNVQKSLDAANPRKILRATQTNPVILPGPKKQHEKVPINALQPRSAPSTLSVPPKRPAKLPAPMEDDRQNQEVSYPVNAGALNVMAALISNPSNPLPEDVYRMLLAGLEHTKPEIRHAAYDLGAILWNRVSDAFIFWSSLEKTRTLQEGTRSMLMYCIFKKNKSLV